MICENNLNILPDTMNEAGEILLATLKELQKEFGKLDQLIAHSLGTVFTAKALCLLDDPKLLPKHICLDRGPSTLHEVSKKYFLGLGQFFHFLLTFTKWDTSVEEDVCTFHQKWQNRASLVITGVEHDHYFSQSANLCLSKKINKMEGIELLLFSPPLQVIHEDAQHSLNPDFLNSFYLTHNSDYMTPRESFPESILRHSFPSTKNQSIAYVPSD